MDFFQKLISRLDIDPAKTNFASRFLLALGIVDREQEIADDQAIELIMEKVAENLKNAAKAQGKLATHEHDWFMTSVRDHGFSVFATFLKMRKPIPARAGSLELTDRGLLNEDQRRLNKALGISDELFLKYNSTVGKSSRQNKP